MPKHRPPSTRAAKQPAATRARRGIRSSAPGARARWFRLGLFLLPALAAAGLWWQRQHAPANLPTLDLQRVDASASATIQKHLEEVIAHPRSGTAWGWLGAILRVYDYNPQARYCLSQAQRLDPANPRWPYFHSLLVGSEAPADALRLAQQAAALCGSQPPNPRLRAAKLMAEQGDWPGAEQELRKLVRDQPDFAPAWLQLAQAAQARSAWPEAIQLATRSSNDPRAARASWSLLAALYQRQGDSAAAQEASQRAASLTPDQAVKDDFEGELALRRGDPRDVTTRCHNLLAAGLLQEAAPWIERLVREHPGQAETWLLQGRLQLLRKQYADAEQSLRRHLQLDPNSSQGLFQLGMVLLGQNQFLPAADTFRQATEIKPDFGPAYFNQAYALARAGQPRPALAAFQESIKHNPEHLEAYILMADLHRQLGELDQARQRADQAALLNPDDARLKTLREMLAQPSLP